jgi:hypothetical protein
MKVLLRAGSDYLEEKIFHYMSGSLFDIVEDTAPPSNEDLVVNAGASSVVPDPNSNSDNSSSNLKSRDKFGNIDELYGSQRFGAFIMDKLTTTIDIRKCKKN